MSGATVRPIYKFGQRRNIESLLREGTFVVGSLDYFAQLETAQRLTGIGDARENGAVRSVTPSTAWSNDLAIFLHGAIEISGGGPGTLSNIRVFNRTDHSLVLSTATGEFAALAPVFQKWGYDAACELTDPEGLLHAVVSEGVIRGQSLIPATQLLTAVDHRKVDYGPKAAEFGDHVTPLEGPFAKPADFEDQCEYRLLWRARDDAVGDRLLVRIPDPGRFFAAVDWHPPAAVEVEPSPEPELEPALQALLMEVISRRPPPHRFLGTLPPEKLIEYAKAAGPTDDERTRAEKLLWRLRLERGIRLTVNAFYAKPNDMALEQALYALRQTDLAVAHQAAVRCIGAGIITS